MNEEETLALIKKGKFLHRECCCCEDGYCSYFTQRVDPNALACIQFTTCNKCSRRATKKWDELIKETKE